jgi:hypothetical protein
MDAAEHLKGMAYHEAGHAVVANKARRVGSRSTCRELDPKQTWGWSP